MRTCPCSRTNRTRRGALRTDVGAGRCEWVRGRAVPVLKQSVGLPAIFRWSAGDRLYVGQSGPHTAVCTHYDTGLLVLA